MDGSKLIEVEVKQNDWPSNLIIISTIAMHERDELVSNGIEF